MENIIKNISFRDEAKHTKWRPFKAGNEPILDELIDKEQFQQSDNPKNQKNIK
jgi:hypothetical protein